MAKSKVYYTDMHVTGERNLLQKCIIKYYKTQLE